MKRDSTIKWNILQTKDVVNQEDVNFIDIQNFSDESESETDDESIIENLDENKTINNEVTDCFGEIVDIDDI